MFIGPVIYFMTHRGAGEKLSSGKSLQHSGNVTIMYREVYRSLQEFTGVYRSLQEFIGVYRSLQEFTGVYRSLQEFTGVYRSLCRQTDITKESGNETS